MMSARNLLPGEYAVLGLLGLRPMHGYEMARYFDRDDLTEVCPLEQSALYAYIRNVEERGYVRWQERRVGLRPPRKTYALTDEGRTVLARWLSEPVERLREVRLDFLLKLYFLRQLDPPAAARLLAGQVERCERYRDRLAARANEAVGFSRLVVTSKLSAAEATVEWLRACLAEARAEQVPA
jgi:DNA-binding PadR family transcriptional regulator